MDPEGRELSALENYLKTNTIYNNIYGRGTEAEFWRSDTQRKLLTDKMTLTFASCLSRREYHSLMLPSQINPTVIPHISERDFFEGFVKSIMEGQGPQDLWTPQRQLKIWLFAHHI